MKYYNYELHINGRPTPHRVRMTPTEAERTNETMQRFGKQYHATDEPLTGTPFTVQHLDGTRQRFDGQDAFNAWLDGGGMDQGRRMAAGYISQDKPVRRAA